jgi:hypothetical protein
VAIRYRQRGTGLTKRPQMVLDNETLVEGLTKLAKQNKPSPFEGWARGAEQWAHEVLRKAGHDADELNGTGDLRQIARDAEEDSDEDFAARILAFIVEVRSAIRDGDAARAAMSGVRLGEAVALHDTKTMHEPTWSTGDKQRRALGRVRESANTTRHRQQQCEWARWNEAAAPIWQKHPDWTKNSIARFLEKNLKPPPAYIGEHRSAKASTIARRLKKPRKAC